MPKHSRTLTERSTPFSDTCLKFTAIFCEIVIIFLGRNTPNNKFLDVTNKEIKKVNVAPLLQSIYYELEQLLFTWNGRHLVLALFASIFNYAKPIQIFLMLKLKVVCVVDIKLFFYALILL